MTDKTPSTGANGSGPSGADHGSMPLVASRLSAGYGAIPVVRDVDLKVAKGEVVALLGANGAGKTTLLSALAGVEGITVHGGSVALGGVETTKPLHVRANRGLGLITETRGIIRALRVRENLRLGGGSVDRGLELFPELRPLLGRPAGLLSGGEQQILALARILARRPSVILADEVSLGLAPQVTRRLLGALREAADRGSGVVMVEQHTRDALAAADRGYVMQRGSLVLEGSSQDLMDRIDEIEASYLSASIET